MEGAKQLRQRFGQALAEVDEDLANLARMTVFSSSRKVLLAIELPEDKEFDFDVPSFERIGRVGRRRGTMLAEYVPSDHQPVRQVV